MINWLLEQHDDVVGLHGARYDMAEITVLRDSWTALEFDSVITRTAQGDHNTLAVILAWLKERGIHAQAQVFDWRGASHDRHV